MNCNEISFVSVALMAVAKLALANSHQRYVVKSTNDLAVRRVDACSPGERASTKYAARLVEPTPHVNGHCNDRRDTQRLSHCSAVAFER